jgi:hypothetical protein
VSDPTGGWAKATEEASGAAKEGFQTARELGRFLAPAFRPLVGVAADHFEIWRAERQVRLYERFMGFLRERGLDGPSRVVAPDFLLPLIERGSIVGEDDLQNVWAIMLANAADADSGVEMRTAYVSMLGEMTHLDVVILAKLSAEGLETEFKGFLPTSMLPEMVGDDGKNKIPTGEVAVSLANLGRLACIHPTTGAGGWFAFGRVTITALGRAFVTACTNRKV